VLPFDSLAPLTFEAMRVYSTVQRPVPVFAPLEPHQCKIRYNGTNAVIRESRDHRLSSQLPLLRVKRRSLKSRVIARASADAVRDGSVSVVLLAGGVGKRMGAPIPKQYIELLGKPIATYSMETFLSMACVGEIVVVCEPEWRYVFEECLEKTGNLKPVKFALPGAERQDSVSSGLSKISSEADLVAIHDSARPLVTAEDTMRCVLDALDVGAAVLGVAVKPTIKEVDESGMVVKTLRRSSLMEVQTPQCIRPSVLREGFEFVDQRGLEVTDDVSIIEAMGLAVRVTPGSYSNIKVTTPEDLSMSEGFIKEQRAN
jgi:2-C-methyl-D-erythritol 4-phosphate cytidylyltransferase